MRDWHSAWSWLKERVAADSVAGNTFTGMLTKLTLRKPFHVARAAIRELYRQTGIAGSGFSGARVLGCSGSGSWIQGFLGSRVVRKFMRTNDLNHEHPRTQAPENPRTRTRAPKNPCTREPAG